MRELHQHDIRAKQQEYSIQDHVKRHLVDQHRTPLPFNSYGSMYSSRQSINHTGTSRQPEHR